MSAESGPASLSEPGGLATIVLAAGAGKRFGGIKQLALVDGEPILGRVLASLAGVGDRRIVVLGAAADVVAPVLSTEEWTVVCASDWEDGPGASLRAGLTLAPTVGSALIVLGDLAWLQKEAVERVLAAAQRMPPDVEAIRAFDGPQPGHPLLIRGSVLAAARSAPNAGLRPLFGSSSVAAVDCSGLGVSRDVDTAADLF